MSLNRTNIVFAAFVVSVLCCLPLYYIEIAANQNPKFSDLSLAPDKEMVDLRDLRCLRRDAPSNLAWILHFNYKPHPKALKSLLCHYADHFRLVVIVSPTGRVGQLLTLDPTTYTKSEVIWAEPCPNRLHGAVAGLMMRCYATGLELLTNSSSFDAVEYVVLSNDDVILNMTKVKEFASDGRPASQLSPSQTAPPLFDPPAADEGYFKGWAYASWWPECNKLFSKVPPEFKARFRQRQGELALKGGCDVFFLPKQSVQEFLLLSSIVGACWLELSIPNSLAMLSEPIRFFAPPSEVFMYRWWGTVIKPRTFESELGNLSIVAFHPFKLSYPKHRAAFAQFMTKYKLN